MLSVAPPGPVMQSQRSCVNGARMVRMSVWLRSREECLNSMVKYWRLERLALGPIGVASAIALTTGS